MWDVITDPCSNFNGFLTYPPLKLGRGWVITSHCLTLTQLFIHALSVGGFRGCLQHLIYADLRSSWLLRERVWGAVFHVRPALGSGQRSRHRTGHGKDTHWHDDVIKWKHFPLTDPSCGEFTGHRWIPHKGQWRGALMFSLIYAWKHGWVIWDAIVLNMTSL